MWDKHRRIRKDSRKRAMRAAQERAARRGGEASLRETPPEPEPEPAEERLEPEEPLREAEPEVVPTDPKSSMAWTGLVLLTLLLGSFVGAMLFMLG